MDDINALGLHQAVAAVAPIEGVAIGNPDDRSTWRVDFTPTASEDQRKAAMAVLTAFDLHAPPVPREVAQLSFRRALRQAGLIDQVNVAVKASAPDVQDAWEFAGSINRTDPLITAIGSQLNLTAAALDHLFILAATL